MSISESPIKFLINSANLGAFPQELIFFYVPAGPTEVKLAILNIHNDDCCFTECV